MLDWITRPNKRRLDLAGGERVIATLDRTVSWRVWAILVVGVLFGVALASDAPEPDASTSEAPPRSSAFIGALYLVLFFGIGAVALARYEAKKSAFWVLTNQRLIKRARRSEASYDVRDIARVSRRRALLTWALEIHFKDGQEPLLITRTRNGGPFTAKLLEVSRAHHDRRQDVNVNIQGAPGAGVPADPLAALKLRYVNGEIDDEEYERKRAALGRP